MSYRLTLEVPDDVYQRLLLRAKNENRTVEEIALEILAIAFADTTNFETSAEV